MMSKQRIEDEEETPEDVAPGALKPKQERALQALLTHPTQKEAAAAAGVSDTTVWRYMRDGEFCRRLREARQLAVAYAAVRLQGGAADAVAFLRDLVAMDGAPPAARVAAARTVLDYSFRVVETDDLKARLGELEQFVLRRQEEEALERGRKTAKGENDED